MAERKARINEAEVKKAIQTLGKEGVLFEVRAIGGKKGWIYSGYFTNSDTLCRALYGERAEFDDKNIYITLNSIKEECYAREQHDKFLPNVSTTKDNHIDHLQWLFIDVDPVRVEGISSSDDEFNGALLTKAKVRDYLKSKGFKAPLEAVSGNGAHLLYKIDLENTPENVQLLEKCLKVLSAFFSDQEQKIDTVNFNPSRICKLYGTLAKKGTDTEERPHRMSHLTKIPDKIEVNDRELLEDLANEISFEPPKKPQYNRQYDGNSREFDIKEWLSRYGLGYKEEPWKDGAYKLILDCCPFDSSHTGKDAVILVQSNGAISFKCFHDSCSGHTWQELRQMYEPDAYEPKTDYQREARQQNYTSPKPKEPPINVKDLVRCAAEVEEKEVEWLIPGYIPKGCITTIAGEGGVGKTTIWSNIVASITTGKQCFLTPGIPFEGVPADVLVFSGEDSWSHILKRRLMNSGADLNRVFFIGSEDEKFKDLKFDSELLQQVIEQVRPALVLFDPIQAFVPKNLHMGDRNAMRDCFNPLLKIGEQYNIATVLIVHANKQSGVWGRKRIADSSDIWDASRSVLMVGEVPNSGHDRYISHEKSNWSITGETVIFEVMDSKPVFKMTTNKKDRDFMSEYNQSQRQAPAKTEAKDFILDLLEHRGEIEIKDLEEAANLCQIKPSTLKTARSELIAANVIKRTALGFGKDKKFVLSLTDSDEVPR